VRGHSAEPESSRLTLQYFEKKLNKVNAVTLEEKKKYKNFIFIYIINKYKNIYNILSKTDLK